MLLGQKEAQKILPMSLAWFERSRWAGSGPPFKKIGGRVFYKEDELRKWVDTHKSVSSTTEAEEFTRKEKNTKK